MKKFKDGFEGKKVYGYEFLSPLGDFEDKKTEKGKIPDCLSSVKKIIEKSSVVNYEGGTEILDCGCGNHKVVIEASYEFVAETEEQLVSDLDRSSIKITVYQKLPKKK